MDELSKIANEVLSKSAKFVKEQIEIPDVLNVHQHKSAEWVIQPMSSINPRIV